MDSHFPVAYRSVQALKQAVVVLLAAGEAITQSAECTIATAIEPVAPAAVRTCAAVFIAPAESLSDVDEARLNTG
jgi:hypothetical protein